MGLKKLAWIIPVAVTGVIVLVLGGIYLSIMDHGKSNYTPTEITNKQLMQRQLVRAFKDTEKEKVIEYKLDQDCLNQILYNATEEIRNDAAVKDYIGDFYVKISGNNYKFYVNANLKIVRTRVILDTKLVDKGDDYIFQIKSINLGNFPAKWLVDATGILNKVDLGKLFEDFGLSIKADLEHDRLVYNKADMRKDMVTLMSSPASAQGNEQELLKGALETFNFQYNFEGGIDVKSDLTNFVGNSKISDDRFNADDASKTSNHNVKYKNVLEKIDSSLIIYQSMIKASAKDSELASTIKAEFEELRAYGDTTYDINKDIHDNVSSNPEDYYQTPGFNQRVASITEDDIDNFLRGSDIIGKHYVMHYQEEIAYVVVDNMFCDMFTKDGDSFMNFSIGININGLETHSIIETKCEPIANSFKANFSIEHVYYGSEIASESFEKVVKEIFKEAVDPDSPKAWVSYDGATDVMTMDFEKILDTSYLNVFNTKGTKTFYLDRTGSLITDNGALELWFTYTAS